MVFTKTFEKHKGTSDEQSYQSQRLESVRASSRLASLIAMGLFAAFTPLDLFTATNNYLEVSLFRLFTVALLLTLHILIWKKKLKPHPYHASYLIVGSALVCMTVLTALTGGHESSYYAGVILILLGSSLVFPWDLRQMTAMSMFSIALYLSAMLIEARFQIGSPHIFFNNLSFLIGTAILSMAGSEFRDRIQRISHSRYLELAKARNDLQQAHELKDRFFANLSHELRTPLALILGPTRKMLEEEREMTEIAPGSSNLRRLDHLSLIERNAKQLLKHVNDLLEVSRIDAGYSNLQYNQVNASLIVKKIASNFENVASEKGITYIIEAPDELVAALDAHALERILMNLLSNAFKFTPERGEVQVRLGQNKSCLWIRVSDSGPGIEQPKRELVFERFYQVGSPLTRNANGTGLGLSITKSLVELHRGQISVGTSPLGGAEFELEIPLSAPEGTQLSPYLPSADETENWTDAHEAPDSTSPSRVPAQNRNDQNQPLILMIEDNRDFGAFLKSILSKGYRVAHAVHGAQGIEMASQLKPDLILSDIMMPELSGDLVLERLKKDPQLKDTPVLILTAKADDDLRLQLLKDGASDYLIKPFVADELLAKVKNLVSLKVSTDLLREELKNSKGDLASMVREITQNRRILKIRSQELELARKSAIEALRLREEFISVASHELRTPLTSMTLQTQMAKWLLEQHPESFSPRSAQLVRTFDTQVERLVGLVNGMFDVSAIRSGRLNLQIKKMDLVQAVRQCMEFIDPQVIKRHQIKILGAETLIGHWDQARITQVLSNLIANALKHGVGAPVEIQLEDAGADAVIYIRDFGPGIPLEQQRKIFNRFERFTTNPAVGGLGLGLYISKNIIEAHRGHITVESEVGAGTTFTIRMPKKVKDLALDSYSDPVTTERAPLAMARN